MKVHYFQRYHGKENVATANTMLLLSRLYSYSPDKFYQFLKSEYLSDAFEQDVMFTLQEKHPDSIPDATITQEGFKIVIETKRTARFNLDQLRRHLDSFDDGKNRILLTLAITPMAEDEKMAFGQILKEYNRGKRDPILHFHTTFEKIADTIQGLLEDSDLEMQKIVEDYLDYCIHDGLIPIQDAWKYMRMQLAGTTLSYNIAHNLYFDHVDRGFRPHEYLGLYKDKSIRAIGKICARITAFERNGKIEYTTEFGECSPLRKQMIKDAMEASSAFGYDLRNVEHRYFFVEQFYETDFKKVSAYAPRGSRIFDLSQLLDEEKLPDTKEIARQLATKFWY